MHDHGGDLAALQAGLHARRPAANGLRLYTTDFDSVSLSNFYRGRSAFLICSGPSLLDHDLSQLNRRGIVTMGINNSWAVYRPNLWTSVDSPGRFIDTGWKDPGILKFVPMSGWNGRLRFKKQDGSLVNSAFRVTQMPGVFLYRRSESFNHRKFIDEDVVCWGNPSATKCTLGIKGKRSVMLTAVRLLQYLGFRHVYLVGADFKMSPESKYAFDEGRTSAAIKHNNLLYDALNRRFAAVQNSFKKARFHVHNCTPDSGLTTFDHIPFDDAVAMAGDECSKPVDTKGWYS